MLKKIAGVILLIFGTFTGLFLFLTLFSEIRIMLVLGYFMADLNMLLVGGGTSAVTTFLCIYFGVKLVKASGLEKRQNITDDFLPGAEDETAFFEPGLGTQISGQLLQTGAEFNSSPWYLLYSLLKSGFVFYLLAMFAVFALPYSLKYLPTLTVNLICIGIGLALGIIWVAFYCTISIVVNETGVYMYRSGKCYLTFSLFNVINAKNSVTIYACIPDVRRILYIAKGKGKKAVTCHCISKEDFNALIETINLYRAQAAAKANF